MTIDAWHSISTGPIASRLAAALAALLTNALQPAAAALDAALPTRLDADLRCHLGVYALPGQRWLTITGADGQPRALQYTVSGQRTSVLREVATRSFAGDDLHIVFAPCASASLSLTQGQRIEQGRKLALAETTTHFTSQGFALHGKLVMPEGGRAQALAVWIEGSNNNPSTDDAVWPYELARQGVAAFVYDKRGTGASAGAPTSDFQFRALDSAAAVREAQRLAPGIARVGVIGASQGGWVAPLVAAAMPLDFVVNVFALAESPIAQDQALVDLQLQESGADAATRLEARRLSAITERIVRSQLQEGFAELEAFKLRHAGAAWLQAIQPRSYTGLFLKFDAQTIRTHGPAMAQGLDFAHEPLPVLAALQAPQLWLLAGADRQAPSPGTQRHLRQLQAQGRDVDVLVFPQADHGLLELRPTPEGTHTAYAAQQFELVASWILHGRPAGSARFAIVRASSPNIPDRPVATRSTP